MRAKLNKLATRIFMEKQRFGSQWFRIAFVELYDIDIQNKTME